MKVFIGGIGLKGYSVESENTLAELISKGLKKGYNNSIEFLNIKIIKYISAEEINLMLLTIFKNLEKEIINEEYLENRYRQRVYNNLGNNMSSEEKQFLEENIQSKLNKKKENIWIDTIASIVLEKIIKIDNKFYNLIENAYVESLKELNI